MNNYLYEIFLKIEKQIKSNNYTVLIFNKKSFCNGKTNKQLAKEFIYQESKLGEYVCNTIICKWFIDHKDNRYKDFSYILKPLGIRIPLKNVSFDELIEFISPETHKTKE